MGPLENFPRWAAAGHPVGDGSSDLWALAEPVDVTVLDTRSVLISRVRLPGAFVFGVTEDGEVLLNGRVTDRYDDDALAVVTGYTDPILIIARYRPAGDAGSAYRVHVPIDGNPVPVPF
jgi:hypothetical protein